MATHDLQNPMEPVVPGLSLATVAGTRVVLPLQPAFPAQTSRARATAPRSKSHYLRPVARPPHLTVTGEPRGYPELPTMSLILNDAVFAVTSAHHVEVRVVPPCLPHPGSSALSGPLPGGGRLPPGHQIDPASRNETEKRREAKIARRWSYTPASGQLRLYSARSLPALEARKPETRKTIRAAMTGSPSAVGPRGEEITQHLATTLQDPYTEAMQRASSHVS
eukprot:jgi/Tetstr1/462441/TSEL_007439.t1